MSKQPIAITDYSEQRLVNSHVTTSNFMELGVAKYIHVVPKQSLQLNAETFARFDAMPTPSFGLAKIKRRYFFVPYRVVMPSFTDFISNEPHVYSDGQLDLVNEAINIYISTLTKAFCFEELSTVVADDVKPDFVRYIYADDNTIQSSDRRKFTPLGRFAYKIMRQLGYTWSFSNSSQRINLLALFAVARIYLDFYYPSQYQNDDISSHINALLKHDLNYQNTSTSQEICDSEDLLKIFKMLYHVCYDDDLFINAWDNPQAPNNQSVVSTGIRIPDITNTDNSGNPYSTVRIDSSNTPYLQTTISSNTSRFTQYALNALKSLSDYMKRNQLSGARVIDRYLSRFGVKLAPEKLNRCVYLGMQEQIIKFNEVFSTADTDGANLGQYAGKAESYGNGTINFVNGEEYGVIVCIATVISESKSFQGMDRHNMHLSCLDFWTPEFDSLGVQAISSAEVYVPTDGIQSPELKQYQSIFGYGPRFNEYKRTLDYVTGDFVCNSINEGLDKWYLNRDLTPLFESSGSVPLEHNINFIKSLDSAQFNRIFYNTNNDVDHIKIIHAFDIVSRFPGKSLYDTYEFDGEDKAEKVDVDVNGEQMN